MCKDSTDLRSLLEIIEDGDSESREILQSIIGNEDETKIIIQPPHGKSCELSLELTKHVISLLTAFALNRDITFCKPKLELSTFQAAHMLNISRFELMQMIRDGHIPAYKVDEHYRLKTEDVIKIVDERIKKQNQSLQELLELEEANDW